MCACDDMNFQYNNFTKARTTFKWSFFNRVSYMCYCSHLRSREKEDVYRVNFYKKYVMFKEFLSARTIVLKVFDNYDSYIIFFLSIFQIK